MMNEKKFKIMFPFIVMAMMFGLVGFTMLHIKELTVQERHCEDACFENGWPQGVWKHRIETCYCKNKMKAQKLYKGKQ